MTIVPESPCESPPEELQEGFCVPSTGTIISDSTRKKFASEPISRCHVWLISQVLIIPATLFCPLWGKKEFRFGGGKAELK